jgi:hypothetical protein
MAIYTPSVNDKVKHQEPWSADSESNNHADINSRRTQRRSLWMLIIGAVVTLFTYQYFHHGLWGTLNNYNKLPLLVLNGTTVRGNHLNLEIYRPNGPDTYGSFVEQVSISTPGQASAVEKWTPAMLSAVAKTDIRNAYHYQQVKAGPWGLVVPLAAKASVQLPLSSSAVSALQPGAQVKITVEDVSGVKWTYVTKVN